MGVQHSFENKIKPQLCFFLKKPSLVLLYLFDYYFSNLLNDIEENIIS